MSKVTVTVEIPANVMDDLADKVNLRPGDGYYWLKRKTMERALDYCAEAVESLALDRRTTVASDL
jgi:hypothetical protein